ncbi:MAG: diacylglycerol kinase family protein [Patescibacteria group bacterium]
MYYYIFDLKKCRKRSQIEDIKNYLSLLGIGGEYTFTSTAYNASDLAGQGLSKGYNTIVGIGGDDVANKISTRLCGSQAAMGLIPIDASNDLQQLICVNSWKEGADNLRFRKIEEIKIGKTANGGAFLTQIQFNLSAPIEITIEFKDFLVQAKVKNLMVSNFNNQIKKIGDDFLDIVFESVRPTESAILSRISSVFSKSKAENEESLSLFRARSLRLFTNTQIPLHDSEGNVVGKTPQLIESSDENLRLIIGKMKAN